VAEEPRWEEEMLEDLAGALVFPATPDIRGAVLARLHSPERQERARVTRLALTVTAAVVLVAAAVITFSGDAREAVADFLGLSVEGERIEVLPTPAGGVSPTALPTPRPGTAALEGFAQRVARGDVTTRLVLPASLGEPRGYYTVSGLPGLVIVDYGAVQVWEFPYEGDYFIGKGIEGQGNVVQELSIDGHKAYWVSGGQRLVTVNNAAGTPIAGTQRTVTANALLWSADGLYRRIEGAGTLEEALELAGEMR